MDNIHLSNRKVTTITPHDTSEIQLRVIDWRRLYRKVCSIGSDGQNRQLFAGISWGVTGSTLLALIPIYQAANPLDAWVKPAFWIVAVASFIIGLVIWRTMRAESIDVAQSRAELMKDMEELHHLYFPNETLNEK